MGEPAEIDPLCGEIHGAELHVRLQEIVSTDISPRFRSRQSPRGAFRYECFQDVLSASVYRPFDESQGPGFLKQYIINFPIIFELTDVFIYSKLDFNVHLCELTSVARALKQ